MPKKSNAKRKVAAQQKLMRKHRLHFAALCGLIFLSALYVVAVRHENRLAFVALQQLEKAREELQIERGRLLLEKATWARRHNVAELAARQLDMQPPHASQVILLDLSE